MTFEEFEEKVKLLNSDDTKSEIKQYWKLFWDLHAVLIEMEEAGEVMLEPFTKGLPYLKTLLDNDGPEYTYTVKFWRSGHRNEKYEIGVCVRGWPILKKLMS